MPTNNSLGGGNNAQMSKTQLYGQIALVIAIIAGIVTFTVIAV